MRQEIELNKSQERNLNKVRKKAQRHQEQRELILTDENEKPAAVFIENTEEIRKEKKSLTERLHLGKESEEKEKKEKRFDLKKLIPTLPKKEEKKETLPVQPVIEENEKIDSMNMQEFFEPIRPLNQKEETVAIETVNDPFPEETVEEKKESGNGKIKDLLSRIKKKEKQPEIIVSLENQENTEVHFCL